MSSSSSFLALVTFCCFLRHTSWCTLNNGCCGKSQSPIDLSRSHAQKVNSKSRFVFRDYEKVPSKMTAENNGHSVSVVIEGVSPTISGGNLPGTYKFHSFHFHWGSDNGRGSEHTIERRAYPLECDFHNYVMNYDQTLTKSILLPLVLHLILTNEPCSFVLKLHLVHFKSEYKDIEDALASGKNDALAVLGVIYELKKTAYLNLNNLVNQLQAITKYKRSIILNKRFQLASLLPTDTKKFFRYSGSLTTPGCNQVVIWTVFEKTFPITNSQLQAFRNLFREDGKTKMVDNFRSVQPLNGRTVQLITTN